MANGAIYHLKIRPIRRHEGQSATAAAAYQTGAQIVDGRTGVVSDYSRRHGVASSHVILPPGAPPRLATAADLANAMEGAENRSNSVVGRSINGALPACLSDEDREAIMLAWARAVSDRYGCGLVVARHVPHAKGRKAAPQEPGAEIPGGDMRNHHFHAVMTSRTVTPDGLGEKLRVLDSAKTGSDEFEWIRAEFARIANERLAAAGAAARVDHRSKARIGAERGEPAEPAAPQLTRGELAAERAGRRTRKGDRWRRTRKDQEQQREDRAQLREVRQQARAAERNARSLRLAEDEAETRFAVATAGPDTPPRLPDPQPQETKPMLHLLIPDPSSRVNAERRIAEIDAKRRADAVALRRPDSQRWRADLTNYLAELAASGRGDEPLDRAFGSLLGSTRAAFGLTNAVTSRVAHRVRRSVAVAAPGLLNLHDRLEQGLLRVYLASDNLGRRAAARITSGWGER